MIAFLQQLTVSIHGIAAVFFWVAAAFILYVYIGYPALMAFFSIFCRRVRSQPDYYPSVSILITAHNEEASIGQKIEETLKLDYPPDRIEILVLSDASTDQTESIVGSFKDPRVRLLRMEERRGKTHAQNEGVKTSNSDIIVFSDATTSYCPLALRFIVGNYRDPAVGAVSGCYQYVDRKGHSPTGLGMILFWNYENLIKTFQDRIRTITGSCGFIYSIRKRLYTELPDHIISDLVQPLRVIIQGYRVVFEDRALAYEETTKSTSEEFMMRVRVVSGAIFGILSVTELLNPLKYGWVSFQLLSHKILRWLVPLFLLMLLSSSAILALEPGKFRLFLCFQMLFYLLALLPVWWPSNNWWKPLTIPLYFCTLNAAALISFLQVVRGTHYAIWEPVRRVADEN
jgi:cellulose synthase/poly-beta-1,6-N-acetylglucosamine synthase-like glycosyltransferase